MHKTIRKLHKKPHHVRKQVAFGVSALVTLFIFGIWTTTVELRSSFDTQVLVSESVQSDQVASPISSIRDNFNDTRSGIFNFFEDEVPGELLPVSSEEIESREYVQSDTEVTYSFEE